MAKIKRLVLTVLDSPRRDFEWRLFLATRLARSGISSAIGSKRAIRSLHGRTKNAILFGRLCSVAGRSKDDLSWVDSFPMRNTKWIFLHDEGGIYPERIYDRYVKRGYPEQYFSEPYLSKILFWGERQQQVFAGHQFSHKFQVVGSPRLDLMRSEYDSFDRIQVLKLKQQYGPYTLICSRFALANKVVDEPHPLHRRFRDILGEAALTNDPQSPDVIRQQFARWNKTTHEFADFISAVAELLMRNPRSTFVIRPHPTERATVYDAAFSSFGNAYIDKSADVRPLIRAANCVIHSECTTGLEAAVNGKPLINFRPWNGDQSLSIAGTSQVGSICRSVDELITTHGRILASEQRQSANDWTAVSQIVRNFGPNEPEAIERIASAVLEVSEAMGDPTELLTATDRTPRVLVREALRRSRLLFASRSGRAGSRAKVAQEDTKAFDYSDEAVRDLWHSFGGDGRLRLDNGVVWVFPEKSQC